MLKSNKSLKEEVIALNNQLTDIQAELNEEKVRFVKLMINIE